jgi:hypothetical protein
MLLRTILRTGSPGELVLGGVGDGAGEGVALKGEDATGGLGVAGTDPSVGGVVA